MYVTCIDFTGQVRRCFGKTDQIKSVAAKYQKLLAVSRVSDQTVLGAPAIL